MSHVIRPFSVPHAPRRGRVNVRLHDEQMNKNRKTNSTAQEFLSSNIRSRPELERMAKLDTFLLVAGEEFTERRTATG